MITQDELKSLLRYEAETGEFIRLEKRGRSDAGSIAGSVNGKGYVSIEIGGHGYLAHRLAWLYANGEMPDKAIDHIDRDKQNNKMSNLRLATDSENKQNRFEPQKNSTTGLLGVTFHKGAGKWAAQIKKNGKSVYLGLYESPGCAHLAYLHAKKTLHSFSA